MNASTSKAAFAALKVRYNEIIPLLPTMGIRQIIFMLLEKMPFQFTPLEIGTFLADQHKEFVCGTVTSYMSLMYTEGYFDRVKVQNGLGYLYELKAKAKMPPDSRPYLGRAPTVRLAASKSTTRLAKMGGNQVKAQEASESPVDAITNVKTPTTADLSIRTKSKKYKSSGLVQASIKIDGRNYAVDKAISIYQDLHQLFGNTVS